MDRYSSLAKVVNGYQSVIFALMKYSGASNVTIPEQHITLLLPKKRELLA